MRTNRVRALLMGGQACVLYGAAEFSRDTDFAILADSANLERLRKALADLQARVIAVPPFEVKFLRKGHAIHFRCGHPEAAGIRVDVMARLRGVDPFRKLWPRRTVIELPDGIRCDVLSLADLVQAKKTQRDKDWPMLRRLVEAHYFENRGQATATRIKFWLRELRTPELLLAVARENPQACRRLVRTRPLLAAAVRNDLTGVESALLAEERMIRGQDRRYWEPLRKELENLRHPRANSPD